RRIPAADDLHDPRRDLARPAPSRRRIDATGAADAERDGVRVQAVKPAARARRWGEDPSGRIGVHAHGAVAHGRVMPATPIGVDPPGIPDAGRLDAPVGESRLLGDVAPGVPKYALRKRTLGFDHAEHSRLGFEEKTDRDAADVERHDVVRY